MKVITIGRDHDNDVCINDPYVGRHHCQIVQYDDGSFTIVDMNSTNGTYVNGRRVFGEIRLQPNDTITIGHINLPWMSYFTSVVPPSSSSQSPMALPITLGITGGVLLLTFVSILCFWILKSSSHKAFAFKGDYPDAVIVDMMDEEGIPYTIEAIEGQVCIWFEKGVSYEIARKSIRKTGGKIVAQIPDNGYYLVKVPTHNVQVFLDKITRDSNIDWAYPNMISYSCGVYNYVLDNYYRDMRTKDTARHGYIVEHALQEYGSNIAFRHFNIGNENGFSMCASNKLENGCANSEFFALDSISRLNNDGPIFINMSYGPSLPARKKPNGDPEYYKWKQANRKEKRDYQIGYKKAIKKTIENLKPLEGKDYVVVVAAGNEGVKSFNDSIISYLRNSKDFTEYEKGIMDKHFLLVTAGETEEIHKDYSNEMEEGRYDPWVTKVDISDFKYPKNGKKWRGTSFAAPRAVGMLSSVANEMNLTGAEVLKLAREVTKRDGELTKEALMQAAKEKQSNTNNSEVTIEGVLRMYIVNNSYDGMIEYDVDEEGSVVGASDKSEVFHGCYRVNEYHETDNVNNYLAFVVETDNAVDVTPYLDEFDKDYLDKPDHSAFMVVPRFSCSKKDFALKYANKRVKATGSFYVVLAGWRHATVVEIDMEKIELCEIEDATPSKNPMQSLAGTKWEMPQLAKRPRKHLHRVEFVNDHQVKIISLEDNGINNPYNTDTPYDCYYNSETNRIVVKRWINPSLWYDFEQFEYKNNLLYGWSYGEEFAYKKVESAKPESPVKHSSGMGQYDYKATIAYSEELFKNKSQGRINLPNGDVIKYQYVYECDFLPEYYMRFTLGNGGDITSKYSIALVETIQSEKGYVGTDENGFIDMRISYMGFDPKSNNEMIVLIRKK